jgi:hypothetical protein
MKAFPSVHVIQEHRGLSDFGPQTTFLNSFFGVMPAA